MRHIASYSGLIGRRLLGALILLAFLAPSPVRTPADDLRAAALALGVLCTADGSGEHAPHVADGHCTLCLLPALGDDGARNTECALRLSRISERIVRKPTPYVALKPAQHPARAPPASIV